MKQLGRRAQRKQARLDKKQRKNDFFVNKNKNNNRNNNNKGSNNNKSNNNKNNFQNYKNKSNEQNKSHFSDGEDDYDEDQRMFPQQGRKRERNDSFGSDSSEEITTMEQLRAPRKKNREDVEYERQQKEKDDKEIRRYEKLLKLKTYTKKNRLPKSFYNDGLGELIEICDKKEYSNRVSYDDMDAPLKDDLEYLAEKRRKRAAQPLEQSSKFAAPLKTIQKNDNDSDEDEEGEKENESDLDQVDDYSQEKKALENDEDNEDFDDEDMFDDEEGEFDEEQGEFDEEQGEFDDEHGEFDDEAGDFDDEEGDFDDQEGEFDEELDDEDGEVEEGKKVKVKPEKIKKKVEEYTEDIYGFVRDKAGNIVANDNTKRDELLNSDIKVDEVLQRKVRGLLNRLTADNIKMISKEILALYKSNSRAIMNKAIWNCFEKSVFELDYQVPAKLISEMAMLIVILFAEMGEEVGAFFIHALVKRFDDTFGNRSVWNVGSKKLNNIFVFILNLYSTGLFDSEIIYDIFDKFCEQFSDEKSIEVIDMALKAAGFLLRKENAGKMKDLIQKIQTYTSALDVSGLSGARAKFILDSLTAIKNNNVAKLKMNEPVVMQDLIDSTLKGVIKKTRVQCIPGSYKQVIQSAHWYSWTKEIVKLKPINDKSDENADNGNGEVEGHGQSSKLFEDANIDYELRDKICKKLRINTPLRKELFTAIFQCQDFLDAACKLISIGKRQFSEVMNIVLLVGTNEKKFNEFYIHLIEHLTTCDRKYKLALDFAIRDKIGQIESQTDRVRSNLEKFISQLMIQNVVSITVLKVVEFSDMNEQYVHFIRQILEPIFSASDDSVVQNVLSKIPKKDNFTSAIKLFMTCFMSADSKRKYNSIRQLKMKNL